MNFTIKTNYPKNIPVTLDKDDVTFNIPTTTPVKAAILSIDKTQILIPEFNLSHTTTGSDWANSLVVVNLTPSQTALFKKQGPVVLEISVEDGEALPWTITGKVEFGAIAH